MLLPVTLKAVIELFHIPGSSSFAAHCALEEAAADYELVLVDRQDRTDAGFRDVTPVGKVPALRAGEARLYETGAILLWVADTFPQAGLAPTVGTPARTDLYRWIVWTANTLHPALHGYFVPRHFTDEESGYDGVRRRSLEAYRRCGEYLERELAGRVWCLRDAYSVVDSYVYMLTGWASYLPEGTPFGGRAVAAHFQRVGARPAIARVRESENLDECLQRRG